MKRTKAARNSGNYPTPKSALVKPDYKSISQLEAERKKRDDFMMGSYGAAAALCAMFVVLSVGCVMGLW